MHLLKQGFRQLAKLILDLQCYWGCIQKLQLEDDTPECKGRAFLSARFVMLTEDKAGDLKKEKRNQQVPQNVGKISSQCALHWTTNRLCHQEQERMLEPIYAFNSSLKTCTISQF